MITGYKVSGHAGFAEEGMDIICSAVSALTQAILQTMVYGVESIARQCPQYVRIQEHRR